ncbi:MAG: hypothetical protein GF400_07870 [Candidatus Eisenbacteria bacterium]|nr:hypothetical protein [Candidatus Eisenbacteria bacterium]
MRAWRAINTGHRAGPLNMAIDEVLLRGVASQGSPPTVRVFGWRPPTVSIGHSQDPERELDLEACRRAGIGVVRRPTGGRAVLHAGELTYSIVGSVTDATLGRTIMETYLAVSRALLSGLESLGVRAELQKVGGVSGPRPEAAAPPCFASAGRYEILAGGRKLVGSAQRRLAGAVLQHGSVLLDGTHARIVEFLRIPDDRRARVRETLERATTDVETLLGRRPRFDEVAEAMTRGFEREWRIAFVHDELGDGEEEAARSIASDYCV